jgi:hypothetical protein
VQQERQHRSIIYRAHYAAMNDLVGYLMENCCAGAGCPPMSSCDTTVTVDQPERKFA